MPDNSINDSRFKKVQSDPRFIKLRKNNSKIKIDSRFKNAIFSKKSDNTRKVDKYGRPISQDQGENDMKRFYRLENEEEERQAEKEIQEDDDNEDFEDVSSSSDHDDEEEEEIDYDELFKKNYPDSDNEADQPETQEGDVEDEKLTGYELARGSGMVDSSSDEESEEVEEAQDEKTIYPLSIDEDSIPRGDETNRFAVVNMDWDQVKAKDLFKVFEGFTPKGGKIKSVKVYPSEFGKEQITKEQTQGPPSSIFNKQSNSTSLIQADDGKEFNDDELRKYQLSRLRYYYAVVECDSKDTAMKIYNEVDGSEFETSSNFFDLRFIPDDVTFEDEVRDECLDGDELGGIMEFSTLALQHSKVKLTWDQDDTSRVKITKKKFSKEEIKDMDFKAYIASSSEEEEEDDDALKEKYRSLLNAENEEGNSDGSEEEEFGDMEMTFIPGAKDAATLAVERLQEKKNGTTESIFEANLRKQREKRQAKKLGNKSTTAEKDDDDLISDNEHPDFNVEDLSEQPQQPKLTKNQKKRLNKKKSKPLPTEAEKTEKAQLELLMLPDKLDTTSVERHFDAKEIIKSEKNKKRKNKKKKLQEGDVEGLQSGFELNVNDDRFKAVLDNHEFALDPTNPKFQKTEAMTKILEERRNRSSAKSKAKKPKDETDEQEPSKQISSADVAMASKSRLDLLVESVKRKSAIALEKKSSGKRPRTK